MWWIELCIYCFHFNPDYDKTFQKEIMLQKCYFEQVLLCDSVNTADFEKNVIYYSIMYTWTVLRQVLACEV